MKKIRKSIAIPIVIILIMILLNIIARCSNAFSDFYVEYIFPYIMTCFSFITGLFPFSVGELLIKIGIIAVILGIPSFIILMIFRKRSRKKTAIAYCTAALWILTFILSTETTNCFIMYQCTKFSEKYFSAGQHDTEQLVQLYNILAEKANELSEKVERDSSGMFKLTSDLNENAKKAMKNISGEYSQLEGFYPNAKAISSSFFMSQNNLLGIYFPFSLEANYNPDVYDINLPDTVCHEFAHLKGIIQEDEAGFIAFIACINSDNAEFQYSGCINALEYVHNEMYKQKIDMSSPNIVKVSDNVIKDGFVFVPEEYWEENKEKEIISTETVETISDFTSDTSLKLNGVEDGTKSYCRIVNLLLDYYFS